MTITFYLEAPIQSWGDHSYGTLRDTCSFPTKSGIVGLLGAALGIKRNDPALIDISQNIKIAVRADRAGSRMTDFQTVNVWDADIIEKWGAPVKFQTKITERDYLQDACFLVAIEGDEELMSLLVEGLRHPRWVLFLGRKGCLPSTPIVPEIFEEPVEIVIKKYPLCEKHDETVFYEMDSDYGYYKQDDLLGNRQFGKRIVNLFEITETTECSHD